MQIIASRLRLSLVVIVAFRTMTRPLLYRGSHLYRVPCRSVCDRPESRLNQAIKALFEGRSRGKGGLQAAIINGSKTRGCNLILENQTIKSLAIKRLCADQSFWSRSQTLQQATYKWPPLDLLSLYSACKWVTSTINELRECSWVNAWASASVLCNSTLYK